MPHLSAEKILTSDDDPSLARLYDHFLGDLELQCINELSSLKTLDIIQEDKDISMLITDISKPFMDGEEMIRRITALDKTKHLPIMVCSARCHDANRFFDPIKVDLVIGKPMTIKDLKAGINLLIRYDYDALEQHLRTSAPENSVFKFLY
jgi:two-component system sensor histidine kinase EvgS